MIAQWFSILDALVGDLSSFPSILITTHNHAQSPVLGDPLPSPVFHSQQKQLYCKYFCASKIVIHIK